MAVGLTAGALTAMGASPASADTTCDPGADVCVVQPDAVQTPLGVVTVSVGAGNVVTVQLAPSSPNTLLLGIPFALPPGPPCRTAVVSPCAAPGYAHTSVPTAGGLVDIDTFLGTQGRFALPSLAVVSIHPPGPCRARATGWTVVFTPVIPPGPPA